MKKKIGHLFIYGKFIFFGNLLITFRHYYYAKYVFLTSLIWLIFFIFLLHREVLKFWSYWTFDWECTRKASLIEENKSRNFFIISFSTTETSIVFHLRPPIFFTSFSSKLKLNSKNREKLILKKYPCFPYIKKHGPSLMCRQVLKQNAVSYANRYCRTVCRVFTAKSASEVLISTRLAVLEATHRDNSEVI